MAQNEEKMREAFISQGFHPDIEAHDWIVWQCCWTLSIAQGEQERELLQQELRITTSKVGEYSKWHDQLVAELSESQKREAELQAKLSAALEALDEANDGISRRDTELAKYKEARPIATLRPYGKGWLFIDNNCPSVEHDIPLYAHPDNAKE
jgi:septal ring factor EnvC (AmiA/AmiB activator)